MQVFASRFREAGGGYRFRMEGTDYTLAVSEEEYLAGLERLRLYADLAKGASLATGVAGIMLLMWQLIHGGINLSSLPIIASAGIVRAVSSGIATRLALHPFRRKILAEVRDRRGWRRRGVIGGIVSGGIDKVVGAMVVVLVVVTALVWREHLRRVDVLAHGTRVDAVVTYSGQRGRYRRNCGVDFRFDVVGTNHSGTTTLCVLMESHPVGARIPVRFDPADPDGALAEGEWSWGPTAVVPLLLWPFAALGFFGALVPRMLGYAPVPRKRRKPLRR